MKKRKSRKGIPLGKFYTIFYTCAPGYKVLMTEKVRAQSADLAEDKFLEKHEMKSNVIIHKVEWSV